MVCVDVDFGPLTITQNTGAGGNANLALTGAGNANLALTVKASGLPPSSPALCALICVVDGIHEIFDLELFDPCGTTTAGGKLTHTGLIVPFSGEPFQGGCLLPVPAVAVQTMTDLVVCAPGFGTFLPFPQPCATCPAN
jgi:hypothetical protein